MLLRSVSQTRFTVAVRGVAVASAAFAAMLMSANGASAAAPQVVAYSSGMNHTCVNYDDGTIKCWGGNYYATLGDGTTNNSGTPVAVSGITTATQVSAGYFNTCALLANSSIKCWGWNAHGELGDGTTTDSGTPVSVSGISNATKVTVGQALICALLADTTVKCWGDGNRLGASTPAAVSGLTGVVDVSAGGMFACAVKGDGTVWCWGEGGSGQLGNDASADSATPVQVSGITTATQVASGAGAACALLSDGSARCWGAANFDQLGDGSSIGFSDTPVVVTGLTDAVSIARGANHTCVLRTNATAYCWGDNRDGQVGTSNYNTAATIQAVKDYNFKVLTGISRIQAGGAFGVALMTDGTFNCWGSNFMSALGDFFTNSAMQKVPYAMPCFAPPPSPPSAPSLLSQPNSVTSSNSGQITFWVESGSTPECQLDGGSWAPCTSPYSFSGLADGDHTFKVRTTKNGLTSEVTSSTWNVDRTPPAGKPSVTLTSPTSTPTRQTTASITYSGPDGATAWVCSLDGGSYAPCSNSPVSLSGLANGSHTYSVKGKDAAGNLTEVATVSWTVDTTPPANPVLSFTQKPSDPSGANVTFAFTVSPALTATQSTRCTIVPMGPVPPPPAVSCSPGTPFQVTGLQAGEYQIYAGVYESNGTVNPNAPVAFDSFQWTVGSSGGGDTGPVSLTLTQMPIDPSGPDVTFQFTLSRPLVGTELVMCVVDSTPLQSCSAGTPVAVKDLSGGNHRFLVAVLPSPGPGQPIDIKQFTWTVAGGSGGGGTGGGGSTKPNAPVLQDKPSGTTNAASGSITFTGDDGASFECQLDGGAWTACTSPFGFSGLADGAHTFKSRATKGGVASDEVSHSWSIDTTAPPAPKVTTKPSSPTDATNATIAFEGSGEPGGKLECKIDDGSWAPCSSPIDLKNLIVGPHKVQIRETDAAGNTGATTTVDWTVQATSCLNPLAAPPTPNASLKLTHTKGVGWKFTPSLVFKTGDPRPCAQLLTVQVSMDAVKPSDTMAIPTKPSYEEGILAWGTGELKRMSLAPPRWVRVGNKIGRWTGWVKLVQ